MENIKITIADNGTTTLATAGKYCDRNVEVEVSVPTGGGGGDTIPVEAFEDSINNKLRFASPFNNWLINDYGDRFEPLNIDTFMFQQNNSLTTIPFALKFQLGEHRIDEYNSLIRSCDNAFENCNSLEEITNIIEPEPYIQPEYNTYAFSTYATFINCNRLRHIPYNIFGTRIAEERSTTEYCEGDRSNMFSGCNSLRELPYLGTVINRTPYPGNSLYYYLAHSCYALDEIVNLPVHKSTFEWENAFCDTVYNCNRLKNFTFETNADGTPKTANWAGQTIDFTGNVGWIYEGNVYMLSDYNSGIDMVNDLVTNLEEYNAKSGSKDWYTTNTAFSRYNKQSALNTINTLPDTSEFLATSGGQSNTVIFYGEAGSGLPDGAINTLTEEEIAVATAKGWTVSLS